MKTIYFVTEGNTDRIVLDGLISEWLGSEDYIPRHIQPPSSEYAGELVASLSQGWKGVVSWCRGDNQIGPAGRDEALMQADCLVIHIDADVAFDSDFLSPALASPATPLAQCDWVRSHLTSLLGGEIPERVVLCVPAQDIEAWVITALYTEISDANAPVESYPQPARLLPKKPYKLTRFRDGELKKVGPAYELAVPDIVRGWINCTDTAAARCPEAARFEAEARAVLGI